MADPKRILIVDDEQDIRTYLSTLLEDQGYETIQAKDGVEAMQQVQAEISGSDYAGYFHAGEIRGQVFPGDENGRPMEKYPGHHRHRGLRGLQEIHLLPPSGPGPGRVCFETYQSRGDSGARAETDGLGQLCIKSLLKLTFSAFPVCFYLHF